MAYAKHLDRRHFLATFYYKQTNEQTKRLDKTSVQQLRHYFVDSHRDWDQSLHPLAYFYSPQASQKKAGDTFQSDVGSPSAQHYPT